MKPFSYSSSLNANEGMPLTDNEIIQRVRSGSKQQYALLVTRYSSQAYTLAVRMLRNKEDAEEAAQDAFVRAFNGLEKFEGSAKFGTWLYRIVYNVCLTKIGNKKTEFHQIQYDDEIQENAGNWNVTTAVDVDYESKETLALIQKIIDDMPLKYGTILSLFYFQDLSHQEICEIVQLPLGTVKTHLHRARSFLQKKLTKEWNVEVSS